jgi:type I restriction enzyme S subunit
MGRCAVVTKKESGWLCGTGSLFLRPKLDLISPIYLQKTLSSDYYKKKLERQSLGTTMANLNTKIVINFKIPSPSKEVIKEFSTIISNIQTQKAQTQAQLSAAEDLYAGLSQGYFE